MSCPVAGGGKCGMVGTTGGGGKFGMVGKAGGGNTIVGSGAAWPGLDRSASSWAALASKSSSDIVARVLDFSAAVVDVLATGPGLFLGSRA